MSGAIREGLESLTVTGPSPVLEAVYREASEAVHRRPGPAEREAAVNRLLRVPIAAVDELLAAAKVSVGGIPGEGW